MFGKVKQQAQWSDIVLPTDCTDAGGGQMFQNRQPDAACNHSSGQSSNSRSSNLQVFVGVLSAAANKARRDAIRETWGADQRLRRIVFVMARPQSANLLASIQEEAAAYNDIRLVSNIDEHYLNITHQTLEILRAADSLNQDLLYRRDDVVHPARMIKASDGLTSAATMSPISAHGQRGDVSVNGFRMTKTDGPLTHVVKTDDDSYLHIGRLLATITQSPLQRTLIGHIYHEFVPISDASRQWYTPPGTWPDNHPKFPYPSGVGYILTMDMVRHITFGGAVGVGCKPGPLFFWEDVSMGLWLYCIQQQYNFSITYSNVELHTMGCDPRNDFSFVTHYQAPDMLRCMHASGGHCCKPNTS